MCEKDHTFQRKVLDSDRKMGRDMKPRGLLSCVFRLKNYMMMGIKRKKGCKRFEGFLLDLQEN